MTAYSSPVRVNSTRRVRGTGCRARLRPCPLTPVPLLPLLVPVNSSCSLLAASNFVAVFFFLPPINPAGRLLVALLGCQCMYGPRPVQT